MDSKKTAMTVDGYIKTFPKDVQARLRKMCATIKKAAPGVVESISYMMIGYKLDGRPLVYLGGFKNHVGFFAMPSARASFKKELAKYECAKSAVQFQHDELIPYGLVARMVKFRVKENRGHKK